MPYGAPLAAPPGTPRTTTGSPHAVRRANTPFDMGALTIRDFYSARGRLGALVPANRPLNQRASAYVLTPATARTPSGPSAGILPLYLMRGRLGAAPPLALRSSRYPSRAGVQGSAQRSALAGRYASNGGRRLGQVEEIATAATSLAPTIDSISQLFGASASGADAERQAKVYSYYEQAMTAPGSVSSIDAVVTLYTISINGYDPNQHLQQNNPQITRTYAQQALQRLSSQGWVRVNSTNPAYTGIGASGIVYAPTGTSGTNTEAAVSQSALPPGSTAALGGFVGGGLNLGSLLVVGAIAGAAYLVITRNRG